MCHVMSFLSTERTEISRKGGKGQEMTAGQDFSFIKQPSLFQNVMYSRSMNILYSDRCLHNSIICIASVSIKITVVDSTSAARGASSTKMFDIQEVWSNFAVSGGVECLNSST